MKELFAQEIKKYRVIDFISITHLCFETLYTNKILTEKNDLFIHLGVKESFVSLYQSGKYLSFKFKRGGAV